MRQVREQGIAPSALAVAWLWGPAPAQAPPLVSMSGGASTRDALLDLSGEGPSAWGQGLLGWMVVCGGALLGGVLPVLVALASRPVFGPQACGWSCALAAAVWLGLAHGLVWLWLLRPMRRLADYAWRIAMAEDALALAHLPVTPLGQGSGQSLGKAAMGVATPLGREFARLNEALAGLRQDSCAVWLHIERQRRQQGAHTGYSRSGS